MPPNSPQTLIPMETFRQVLSWNPYFFYQMANHIIPLTDSCSALVREYQWQRSKQAGRYDIREALATAEQRLSELLNFDVGVRYRSETLDPGYLKRVSGPVIGGSYNYGYGYGGYGLSWWRTAPALIQLSVGKLQKVATVSYTQLVASSSLTYSDTDNDGLNDTFTAVFADTTSDPSMVLVAFSAADQVVGSYTTAGSQEPLDWQIRPVTVTRLNANQLQVVGPAWLLVKPIKYEGYYVGGLNNAAIGVDSSGAIDPSDSNNFVTGLTAWIKVYSNTNYVQYIQRYAGTEYSTLVPATVINAELGELQINLSGCTGIAPSFCGANFTEEIRVNYEAGQVPQNLNGALGFTTDWTQVVIRYAIAELQRPICACADMNQQLNFWQQDLALVGYGESNNQSLFRTTDDVLKCPLGTRRGAVDAWRAISRLALHTAVNLG